MTDPTKSTQRPKRFVGQQHFISRPMLSVDRALSDVKLVPVSRDADIFAEWLRRQGQCVIHTETSYWHSEGCGVYQSFPYHWLIEPSAKELSHLFFDKRVLALRYCQAGTSSAPPNSYHVVADPSTYDLGSLNAASRRNVRDGLKRCIVKPISFSYLVENGWDLVLDTFSRQGRRVSVSYDQWRSSNLAASDLPGFAAWGAFVDGRLGAILVSFRMDACYYMLYQQCHQRYLRHHINNVLLFAATRTAAETPGIKCIFNGMKSLDAPPTVDEFKYRMGYIASPVRQCVAFHPWLSSLISQSSCELLAGLKRLWPGRRTITKAEGLLRACWEGKGPVPNVGS